MNTTDNTHTHAGRFLAKLRQIANDRGKMAALRRGASEATKRQAWPVLASLGEDVGNYTAQTVGALFATHPEEENQSWSFGSTCRQIALHGSTDFKIPDSFDKRFRRLLASDSVEDVAGQFKTWIRFAKAKGIRINYERMYNDLAFWSESADATKLRWARGFWPVSKEISDEAVTKEVES